MIPQYSWCGDGMRARAPADAASEKARDQRGKTLPKTVHKRRCARDTRRDTSMGPIRVPKNRNTPEIATSLRLRIVGASKRGLKPEKSGKSDAQRPISALQRTEGVRNRKKVVQKVEIFVFTRQIVVTKHIFAKHARTLNANQGRAAARNPEASTMQVPVPSPLAKIRASPTEKCNI